MCACVLDEEGAGPREVAAGLRLQEIVHIIVLYTKLGSSLLSKNSCFGSAETLHGASRAQAEQAA